MKISKNTPFSIILVSLMTTFLSTSAWGFVNGQLLLGSSTGEFQGGEGISGDYRSSEAGISVGFDYFPGLPMTAGFFAHTKNLRIKDSGSSINRLDSWSIGPEFTVWYPRFSVMPYLKGAIGFGAYTAMEAGKRNNYTSRAWFSSFTRKASAGIKWEYTPLFAPLMEYQVSTEELDLEESTANISPDRAVLFKSQSILVGFESSL